MPKSTNQLNSKLTLNEIVFNCFSKHYYFTRWYMKYHHIIATSYQKLKLRIPVTWETGGNNSDLQETSQPLIKSIKAVTNRILLTL